MQTLSNDLQKYCDNVGLSASVIERNSLNISATEFGPDSVLFRPGDSCQMFLILCSGSIRVEMTTKSGRDITLYRIKPTESCILTTSALLNNESYYAQAITESAVTAIGISKDHFYKALDGSPQFTKHIVAGYAERISSIIQLVDRLAVRDVMLGLAQYLVLESDNNEVKATQSEIANEVGSAREVIARKLHQLESDGIVVLKRGEIVINDLVRLKQYAQL